jgi:5'(3')-deoxyribonucleotidase
MVIYIDMDDTLMDYKSANASALLNNPAQPFPQSQVGFFLNLEPLEGAVDAYNMLKVWGHRVLFLTAPSVLNPACYTEKRMSVERHFGFAACEDLIIAHDKSLLIGDILIDDRVDSNRQNEFRGKLIHFGSEECPNWESALMWVCSHARAISDKSA